MDLWLKLSLAAAAIFCVAVIASLLRQWHNRRRTEVTSEQADTMLADYRRTHPSVAAMWDTHRANDPADREVEPGYDPRTFVDLDEPLPAAMLAPPNIGGEGHLPYEGPNYVEPEEIAEEMKGIRHWHDGSPWEPPSVRRMEADSEEGDDEAVRPDRQ